MGKIGKLMLLAGFGFALVGLPAMFVGAEIFNLGILKPVWVVVAWFLGSPALIIAGSVLSKKKDKSTAKALITGIVLALVMVSAGGVFIIILAKALEYI